MFRSTWDRASRLPVATGGDLRAELVALPADLPTVGALFTFMRDAELRFDRLRMRIDELVVGSRGEQRSVIETIVQHPGLARVRTTEPGAGIARNYEIWISDGRTVRTYSARHHLGTRRPARNRPVGLDDRDLPGSSTTYRPLTPLPRESLPDTFVHPAGFCQNVLATGDCRIAGLGSIAGRETIIVESDHPRATQAGEDRPDHRLMVATDRETGIILRLVESIGDAVTRDAEVVSLEINPPLPSGSFDYEFPSGTTTIY